MIYFKLLICILVPLALGLAGIAAIFRERLSFFTFFERHAIAFALGTWLLTLIMFSLPFLKIPLTFNNIFLSAGLLLLTLLPFGFKSLKSYIPKHLPRQHHLLIYLLLILIIIKVLFVCWTSWIKPVFGPDLLDYYALAAKHTFIFNQPLHIHHEPPLPFLLESWTPITLGIWNDSFLSLFFPLMLICLSIIFYSSLNRCWRTLPSLFFTFLLVSLPFLFLHAGRLYADFPQAFYYSAATIYLFQFIKAYQKSKGPAIPYLLASLIFLGVSVWLKKSGIYYAGINFLVLACFLAINRRGFQKKEWSGVFYGILLFILIVSPWLALEKLTILSSSLRQTIPALQSSLVAASPLLQNSSWAVISAMARNMFLNGNWQLLWGLFLGLLILYPRQILKQPAVYLLAVIILNLVALFILFRFTDQFMFILNNSMLNRLMLHAAPVVLYFCAEVILSSKKG